MKELTLAEKCSLADNLTKITCEAFNILCTRKTEESLGNVVEEYTGDAQDIFDEMYDMIDNLNTRR